MSGNLRLLAGVLASAKQENRAALIKIGRAHV